MKKKLDLIYSAVKRCKLYVLTIFITYCISCFIGILMAHNGNVLASSYRDKIVGQAINKNKAAINYQKGNNFTAELFDFGGNLILGAVPQTIMVFGIVIPYFSTSVQGWIGGIVSIDSNNKRRFENFKSAF